MLSRKTDPWAVNTGRWLSVQIAGTKMDRINVAGFYLLGARVHALLGLEPNTRIEDALPMLADADEFLDAFVNITVGPRGEQSRRIAEAIQSELQRLTGLPPRVAKIRGVQFQTAAILGEQQSSLIAKLVEQFEAALCSEMPSKGTFYVIPKRAYATEIMLASADKIFSTATSDYLTETAREDVRKAGSCLLFDQFTAAGFHMMRAMEAVTRPYYELVTGKSPIRPTGESMTLGSLAVDLGYKLEGLKKQKLESGLLGNVMPNLDRMVKIYRNPIMHPEMVLDEEEAIEVFDNAKSAIAAMIKDVRDGGPHFSDPWRAYRLFRF